MVDFSSRATEISTLIEPAAAVVQPVDRSNEIDALNNIAGGVEKAAKVFSTFRSNAANIESNKFRADFNVSLNKLTDAFDQGAISGSEYRTKARALLSQAVSNSPNQTDDLLQDYAKFQSFSGIDNIKSGAMQQAEIVQKQRQAAVENGFLSIADVGNPQKEAEAIAALEDFNASMTSMDRQVKELSLKSSKLEIGSKERAAAEEQMKSTILGGLSKVGSKAPVYWETQYKNIKAKVNQAGSEQERQQIINDGIFTLKKDFDQKMLEITTSAAGTLTQAQIDLIMQPQKNLIDTYSKELSGEIAAGTLENSVKTFKLQAEALAMENLDEETKMWIGAASLSKEAATLLAPEIYKKVSGAFAKNSDPNVVKPTDTFPTNEKESKQVSEYYTSIRELVGKYNKGKVGDVSDVNQVKTEIDTQLANIGKAITKYGPTAESAKEFQPTMDLLASPEMREYLQNNKLPKDYVDGLRTVIDAGYTQTVVPLIRDEMNKLLVGPDKNIVPGLLPQILTGDAGMVPASTYVQPTFENGKFGFKPTKDFEGGRGDFKAKQALRNANDSAAVKVVNKMIAAESALSGEDPAALWEGKFKSLLFPEAQAEGTGDQSSVAPGITPDTQVASLPGDLVGEVMNASADASLTIQDFMSPPPPDVTQPTEQLTQAASGEFTGPAANFVGLSDPLEIAKAFDGVDEVRDAKVISSFIKQAAGININPATTAWCAAFVNAVLGASGKEGTGRLNARSFLDWGVPVDTPQQGDVVVLKRGTKAWQGHVGFYAGEEERDGETFIRVVSGNQSDSVNESLYPAKRLLGYRRAG